MDARWHGAVPSPRPSAGHSCRVPPIWHAHVGRAVRHCGQVVASSVPAWSRRDAANTRVSPMADYVMPMPSGLEASDQLSLSIGRVCREDVSLEQSCRQVFLALVGAGLGLYLRPASIEQLIEGCRLMLSNSGVSDRWQTAGGRRSDCSQSSPQRAQQGSPRHVASSRAGRRRFSELERTPGAEEDAELQSHTDVTHRCGKDSEQAESSESARVQPRIRDGVPCSAPWWRSRASG
jgi:hypothetical protein